MAPDMSLGGIVTGLLTLCVAAAVFGFCVALGNSLYWTLERRMGKREAGERLG